MITECKNIRKNILNISYISRHGHIPTCFSVIEILHTVYNVMDHKPTEPQSENRDIFILSKGHAALALYCTLAQQGYFDINDVESFGAFGSDFGCHADRNKIPGIEASTGSLGHGIGLAAGIALSFKIKNSSRKVYTLIGDGEANEGSVWEAVMVAVNLNLNNLTIIYDNNRSHSRGLQIENPAGVFESFGCKVEKVDGHDINSLKNALKSLSKKVKVIVANTKKGYPCKLLVENQYEWHRKSPNQDQLNQLMRELDEETV